MSELEVSDLMSEDQRREVLISLDDLQKADREGDRVPREARECVNFGAITYANGRPDRRHAGESLLDLPQHLNLGDRNAARIASLPISENEKLCLSTRYFGGRSALLLCDNWERNPKAERYGDEASHGEHPEANAMPKRRGPRQQ
jgi:hypothetical protein